VRALEMKSGSDQLGVSRTFSSNARAAGTGC
jgi:hypothetical protein